MKEICEFHSIEEFWKNFTFIPKPSALCNVPYIMSTRSSSTPQAGSTSTGISTISSSIHSNIEGICIFKKGIRPEWEDYNNRDGCEIHCKKLISI